jgi:hypothetical protein
LPNGEVDAAPCLLPLGANGDVLVVEVADPFFAGLNDEFPFAANGDVTPDDLLSSSIAPLDEENEALLEVFDDICKSSSLLVMLVGTLGLALVGPVKDEASFGPDLFSDNGKVDFLVLFCCSFILFDAV